MTTLDISTIIDDLSADNFDFASIRRQTRFMICIIILSFRYLVNFFANFILGIFIACSLWHGIEILVISIKPFFLDWLTGGLMVEIASFKDFATISSAVLRLSRLL